MYFRVAIRLASCLPHPPPTRASTHMLLSRRGESALTLGMTGDRGDGGFSGEGRGGGGGGRGAGSPPQAVMCAALCLAHVTTGTSAALLTREKIMAAAMTLSGLLDVCVDQMEAVAATGRRGGEAAGYRCGEPVGGMPAEFAVSAVMKCATSALWGCLSSFPGKTATHTSSVFVAATTV